MTFGRYSQVIHIAPSFPVEDVKKHNCQTLPKPFSHSTRRTSAPSSRMAKGYDQHQQRQSAVQSMGKDLARRAKSKCELTGQSGIPLQVYEVLPLSPEPDIDRCLLISQTCRDAIERPKTLAGQQWRPLTETIWSELPVAQVMAWRFLQVLAQREDWAHEALENAALDPEVEAWAREAPLVP